MLTWFLIHAAMARPADVALQALTGPRAPGLQLEDRSVHWTGGSITRFNQSVDGIPVLGAGPRVSLSPQQAVIGQSGYPLADIPDTLVPTLRASQAVSVAQDALFIDPSTQMWPGHAALSIMPSDPPQLVWRVSVMRPHPFQTWELLVDAIDGTVHHAEMTTINAQGTVFPASPLHSDPTDVTLQNLTAHDRLRGIYAEAFSCLDWEIDPAPFGKRDCLEIGVTAEPDYKGNYLYEPTYGSLSDPFAEVHAYHHTDLISAWADARWGIRQERPIRVITNFPLTNAFYGDFDGDGVRDTSYGISDDGFNFAYDSDVVYHEYGHAIVRTVAGSMGMGADAIGVDWTSGAINEGTADVFAMVLNGDPLLAEYLGQSERWDTAIRDLEPDRVCPGDLQSQVHRSGQILGALGWNLIETLGPDATAELWVGALASWSGATTWSEVGTSLGDSADTLLDAEVISAEEHEVATSLIEQSGLPDCERIIDLNQRPSSTQTLLNLGLSDEYERFAAGVQFSMVAPAEATAIELEILEFDGLKDGTGWTIYVRAGQPVDHHATTIDGVGLATAHAEEFDLQVDGRSQATIRIDDLSDLKLVPGEIYYFAIASRNLSRAPLDIDYASISVAGRALIGQEAPPATTAEGGCSTTHRSGSLSLWLSAILLSARRRTRRQARGPST